jgi:hypothetical protein
MGASLVKELPVNRLRPHERFDRDPVFRALVRSMEDYLDACDFTPTELREAAILASTRTEMRRSGMTKLLQGGA